LDSIIVFEDHHLGNAEYLREHFKKYNLDAFALPMPPPKQENVKDDELAMIEYYEKTAASPPITQMIDALHDKHFSRISKLTSMPSNTESIIWHPFRQYGLPQDIVAIDSAYGDHFQTYHPGSDSAIQTQSKSPGLQPGLQPAVASLPLKPLLTPLFDGSASWWTQGLGHGNPDLALTAAHAAGRYGHVMFANAVHEPALDLSFSLLSTLANPRLSRVFFTDNGSTGMEVAVKMALRASCARYGWHKDDGKGDIGILGLAGSYHGDTIGVMNCAEPNVFNEMVDWYKPWGYWFDPPSINMRKGRWELTRPASLSGSNSETLSSYKTLDSLFDFTNREHDAKTYESSITSTLNRLVRDEGRRFGALILEPIIMGAGGMIFVDPLFQRSLIKVIRNNPSLVCLSIQPPPISTGSGNAWSGLPVIADEVFTGLYRLGRASSSSFLSSPSPNNSNVHSTSLDIAPDISVHAKLLTGGVLPLALTTASESIFAAFLSDRKQDALLHGHSYTAHAVGCAVANKSLTTMNHMNQDADGPWTPFREAWQQPASTISPTTFSFFTPQFLHGLSHHPRIAGCFALGTVLAMTLTSSSSGYTSTAATTLQSTLLTQFDQSGAGIHSRVLGDVLYLMTSLTTTPATIEKVEGAVMRALG
jgi:bifunctional dethiobiotin synthetase / adenosylmethionine---8-amino-7-oxononanoate aminotransferase